jgi:hypothetical protein
MKPFKLAADRHGYSLYYDRSMKLWACTKEGCESSWHTEHVLKQMGLAKFIITYLQD